MNKPIAALILFLSFFQSELHADTQDLKAKPLAAVAPDLIFHQTADLEAFTQTTQFQFGSQEKNDDIACSLKLSKHPERMVRYKTGLKYVASAPKSVPAAAFGNATLLEIPLNMQAPNRDALAQPQTLICFKVTSMGKFSNPSFFNASSDITYYELAKVLEGYFTIEFNPYIDELPTNLSNIPAR